MAQVVGVMNGLPYRAAAVASNRFRRPSAGKNATRIASSGSNRCAMGRLLSRMAMVWNALGTGTEVQ